MYGKKIHLVKKKREEHHCLQGEQGAKMFNVGNKNTVHKTVSKDR